MTHVLCLSSLKDGLVIFFDGEDREEQVLEIAWVKLEVHIRLKRNC